MTVIIGSLVSQFHDELAHPGRAASRFYNPSTTVDWRRAKTTAWVSRRFAVGWLEGDERGLGVGPLVGESVEVM